MKRVLPILLAFVMAAIVVGCKKDDATKPATDPDAGAQAGTTDTSSNTDDTSSDMTLVSLKVPNMT